MFGKRAQPAPASGRCHTLATRTPIRFEHGLGSRPEPPFSELIYVCEDFGSRKRVYLPLAQFSRVLDSRVYLWENLKVIRANAQ